MTLKFLEEGTFWNQLNWLRGRKVLQNSITSQVLVCSWQTLNQKPSLENKKRLNSTFSAKNWHFFELFDLLQCCNLCCKKSENFLTSSENAWKQGFFSSPRINYCRCMIVTFRGFVTMWLQFRVKNVKILSHAILEFLASTIKFVFNKRHLNSIQLGESQDIVWLESSPSTDAKFRN